MHDTPEAAQNRYDEFIASLGSSGVAFLLSQGNGFANYDDDGEQVIPIWSTRDAAAAGAAEQFATYEVMEFTADQLVL